MRLPKPKKIIAPKYVAGRSLFNQKTVKIKLSANESALGPSPKAIKEYNKVSKNFKRYPDTNGTALRKVIANKFKIDKNRIILGSGSDQIFEFVCNAFIEKNDEVIVPKYSFIIYRIYSKINGAKIIYAKEKNFTISVKNILSKVTRKTKVVFIANPNNPTGTYINKKELIYLRKKLRSDILLVVDDAYFEYLKQKDYLPGLELFSGHKNVLVTRTFSKVYGLAGLRVGWGYASKEIINTLNKIKPPFNVSRPALFAASAAIRDIGWLKKEVNHICKWNKILFKKFKEMKIATNESKTNFLLLNFDKVNISSKNVFQKLAKAGILVRAMNLYGIKNCLRITIGKSKENKKLISIFRKILNV
ncbi:histidinol-phosphate transaminase [Pelagibacterales bacterium SAG-MED05]|nr:histidinol-phosphate transaminase [Pelagibacterales bacterium SAG-MED05]